MDEIIFINVDDGAFAIDDTGSNWLDLSKLVNEVLLVQVFTIITLILQSLGFRLLNNLRYIQGNYDIR